MPITPVRDAKHLKDTVSDDIVRLMDGVMWLALDYADNFVRDIYLHSCKWPLADMEGKEMKDPITGEPLDYDMPQRLARYTKYELGKDHALKRSFKLWVDVEGHPDKQKLLRAGRMLEVYDCRPWGRLKSNLEYGLGPILKHRENSLRDRFA
jgi:hypothetical protein